MISDLRLQQFRSYTDASYEFSDGVNIIVGPNASGKTNMLEAVLLLCRGKSFRAADKDILMHDKDWARLDAHFQSHERTAKWQRTGEVIDKTYIFDNNTYKRLSFTSKYPVVVFEPRHMTLLTDSPSLRRDFLDTILEQITPTYSRFLNQYKRALAQRNALLKMPGKHDQQFVWDVRLSDLGGVIMRERIKFIQDHTDEIARIYASLSQGDKPARLHYDTRITGDDYASILLKRLQENVDKDKMRGFTSIGPHRDDIIPYLGDYPILQSGSRGETRTMLLALKILELQVVEKARGQKPLLLLDDVFSELDGSRRKALTSYLKNHQTFITTTDADIVVKHFTQDSHIILL